VLAVEYFEVVAWSPLNSKPNLGYMAYMDQTFGKGSVWGTRQRSITNLSTWEDCLWVDGGDLVVIKERMERCIEDHTVGSA